MENFPLTSVVRTAQSMLGIILKPLFTLVLDERFALQISVVYLCYPNN